jgi:deoxyribonuclease-4
MRLGLKLWSTNEDVIEEAVALIAKGVFHYVELMVVPDTNPTPFQKYKIPYVLHAAHDTWGANPANPSAERRSRETLAEALRWADALQAEYVVVHPGFGTMEAALKFFEKESDPRIVIENMSQFGIDYGKVVEITGHTAEQLKRLMAGRFGFCLDLNHALCAAHSLQRNPEEYLKELLVLQPALFHISDGDYTDEHLAIGKGKYDFVLLARCLQESEVKKVTLETPRGNLHSLREDEENAATLRSFF